MRYLAIDLGNVVCEVNFNNFIDSLSEALNISVADVDYFLHRTTKLHDLGITHMADELKDHFKIKSPTIINKIINEWNCSIISNQTMNYFLDELRIKNTKIALLSNIGIDHANLMKKTLGSIYANSIRFFSCEVGARKPSYLYYKTFLEMYPEFRGCVYLDDRFENIETGIKFGFNAIQFDLVKLQKNDELKNKLTELKTLI